MHPILIMENKMNLVECFNLDFEPRIWQIEDFGKYKPALQTEWELNKVLDDKRRKYR